MGALHEVFGTDGHIVAQVVEAKFIVRTKGNVGTIGTTTSFAVGPMLVDAVYTETVEHIERAHPFGVTLGQVVVDRHHVNTIARKSIEEDRKGGHKGLSFTRCHFGNLAFVENYTTEQLNIVVNHVPLHVVASGHPVIVINGLIVFNGHKVVSRSQRAVEVSSRNHHLAVLGKATGCTLHDGKGFIHHLVELRLQSVEHFLLQFIDMVEHTFAVFERKGFDLLLLTTDFGTQVVNGMLNLVAQFLRLSTQGIVVKRIDAFKHLFNLLNVRLYLFHIAR